MSASSRTNAFSPCVCVRAYVCMIIISVIFFARFDCFFVCLFRSLFLHSLLYIYTFRMCANECVRVCFQLPYLRIVFRMIRIEIVLGPASSCMNYVYTKRCRLRLRLRMMKTKCLFKYHVCVRNEREKLGHKSKTYPFDYEIFAKMYCMPTLTHTLA